MSLQDFLGVLTPILIAIATAGGGYIVSYLRARQVEQEVKMEEMRKMTAQIVGLASKNVEISSKGVEMLAKNTEMTKAIATGNDGLNEKLKEIAVSSAFKANKLKEAISTKYNIQSDDLDELEKKLKDVIKDKI